MLSATEPKCYTRHRYKQKPLKRSPSGPARPSKVVGLGDIFQEPVTALLVLEQSRLEHFVGNFEKLEELGGALNVTGPIAFCSGPHICITAGNCTTNPLPLVFVDCDFDGVEQGWNLAPVANNLPVAAVLAFRFGPCLWVQVGGGKALVVTTSVPLTLLAYVL